MKNLEYYEEKGFEGCDASLSIALLEYGLMWLAVKGSDADDKHEFVYRAAGDPYMDPSGQEFTEAFMDKKEVRELLNEDWFDWKGFSSYIGFGGSIDEYIYDCFPGCVGDMISYHGYVNIFGESGITFRIVERDLDNLGEFLLDKDVKLETYVRGFYAEDTTGEELADLDNDPKHWTGLIDWERTPQGYEFWECLHEEWENRCLDDAVLGIAITAE